MTTDETSSLLYPNNLRRFLPNLVNDTTVLITPTDNEGTGVGCWPSSTLTMNLILTPKLSKQRALSGADREHLYTSYCVATCSYAMPAGRCCALSDN